MKRQIAILLALTSVCVATTRADGDAETLANNILRDRLAITPRVGASTNLVFVRELNVHVYHAALNTNDKKLKALVAMQILKDMPVIRRSGEKKATEKERLEVLDKNPQFQKLKQWYFELLDKEKDKNLEQTPAGDSLKAAPEE